MDSILTFINSLTPQQWFLIGGFVAALPGTYALTEFAKRHHFKKTGQELWSGFVVLNVAVWGTVLTAVDAITANLGQITHLGSLIPQIAPFVAVWGPRVSLTTLLIHTVASALTAWWRARQAHKPITNPNLPDLSVALQALSSQPEVAPAIAHGEPPQNVLSL